MKTLKSILAAAVVLFVTLSCKAYFLIDCGSTPSTGVGVLEMDLTMYGAQWHNAWVEVSSNIVIYDITTSTLDPVVQLSLDWQSGGDDPYVDMNYNTISADYTFTQNFDSDWGTGQICLTNLPLGHQFVAVVSSWESDLVHNNASVVGEFATQVDAPYAFESGTLSSITWGFWCY